LRSAHIVSRIANDLFAGLANPVRREIVERLSGGKGAVGEVTRNLGLSNLAVSESGSGNRQRASGGEA
jgi:DNA-binding transcriptional ArsR family regulator